VSGAERARILAMSLASAHSSSSDAIALGLRCSGQSPKFRMHSRNSRCSRLICSFCFGFHDRNSWFCSLARFVQRSTLRLLGSPSRRQSRVQAPDTVTNCLFAHRLPILIIDAVRVGLWRVRGSCTTLDQSRCSSIPEIASESALEATAFWSLAYQSAPWTHGPWLVQRYLENDAWIGCAQCTVHLAALCLQSATPATF
jgi:hypothetical protein